MATSSAQIMSVSGTCGLWPLLLLTSVLSASPFSSALAEDTGTQGTAVNPVQPEPETVKGRAAKDVAAQPFPDLYELYYERGLLEYCNLVSPLAGKGFRSRRDDLLARDKPTEEQQRRVRIAAGTAIDNDYLDHGLGGQRVWCRNEGKAAFNRFEAYGRDAAQ